MSTAEPAPGKSTSQPPRWVRYGFVAAGLFNFCILSSSKLFSNNLGAVDDLFSPRGCALICIWGVAYISVYRHVHRAPFLALAFALEKFFYVGNWIYGWKTYVPHMQASADVQFFFKSYGLGDLAFGVFFALTWWKVRGLPSDSGT